MARSGAARFSGHFRVSVVNRQSTGTSTGGSVALQLAVDHPELVRALVMVASAYRLGPRAGRCSRTGTVDPGYPLELDRLVALEATRLELCTDGVVMLTDPVGNEFRLTPT